MTKTIARRSKYAPARIDRGAQSEWELRSKAIEADPCEPGTYRATNGVTLAVPGQAKLYAGRRG